MKNEYDRTLDYLRREIKRHQNAVKVLRAEGHICKDAEKHLTELQSVAELLR